MNDLAAVEDSRVEKAACGETTMVGPAEFICIAAPHDGHPSTWQRHYFVRRYPFRGMS